MKRSILFTLLAVGLLAVAVIQITAAPTVTKTRLYQDRYGTVYKVAVTFDNSYPRGGETITVGQPIDYAFIQDQGYIASDTAAYFINLDSATFSSGTFELLVYKAAKDSTKMMEIPNATNLSTLAGVEVIVKTKR
jgi:hypothetical protein